jgi:hypothetical protein
VTPLLQRTRDIERDEKLIFHDKNALRHRQAMSPSRRCFSRSTEAQLLYRSQEI